MNVTPHRCKFNIQSTLPKDAFEPIEGVAAETRIANKIN